jgi:hypothetical protein
MFFYLYLFKYVALAINNNDTTTKKMRRDGTSIDCGNYRER